MVGLTCRVGAHNSRYAHDTRLYPIAISNFTRCFVFANSISVGIFIESCVRVGVHFFQGQFLENNYL